MRSPKALMDDADLADFVRAEFVGDRLSDLAVLALGGVAEPDGDDLATQGC